MPNLNTMKKARSCHELNNLSNDEQFDFASLLEELTGHHIQPTEAESPEAWMLVRRLIDALEQSTRLLNYLLAQHPSSDDQTVYRLKKWLSQYEGSDVDFEVRLAQSMLDRLLQILFDDGGLPADGRPILPSFHLLAFHREAPEPDEWAGQTFDVFISYKHSLYSGEAEYLYKALKGRGLNCWLDRNELALAAARVPDSRLKQRLRYALRASHCTLFFETVAEATVDESFRGERTAYSWQIFEHRNANDLLYVRSTPRRQVWSALEDTTMEWNSLDDIADIVQERSHSWQDRDPRATDAELRAQVAREPDLDQAVAQLGEAVEQYFQAPTEVAPLAALALLAPGDAERHLPALASEVFIHAMRYDPASALLVAQAGLDLYGLFAAGAKLTGRRWSEYHRLLMTDLFGDDPRSALRQRIAREGRLGIDEVLLGIVEAVDANSFGSELLTRTLRYMNGSTSDDEVNAARERLRSTIADAGAADRTGTHGWLFLSTDAGWRTYPVVTSGLCMLAPQQGLPDTAVVLCRQSRRLHPDELIAELDTVVNAGSAEQPFERLLTERPEMAHTFSGLLWVSNVLELAPADDECPMFLYDLHGAHQVDERSAPTERVGARELTAALEAALTADLGQQEAIGGPFSERRQRPAVLLAGDLDRQSPTDRLSFLAVCMTVLCPLWEYGRVRDLEYDDF